MEPYLTPLISFLVTYFSMPIFRGLAIQYKLLDLPGGRKIHKVATPLLGGAAIYLGLLVGVLFNLSKLHPFLPVLLGATLILILGLINDIKEISAHLRFFYQTLIALAVAGMGVRVSFLPAGFWGDILEIVLTVFWLVGVTNAYNYLDGLDGLAAGSAVVNLGCFSIILYITGQYPLALLSVILIGVCLGFLPYNFRKTKVFLGEAGSTFLGFILAGIGLLGIWAEDNMVKVSIPILILGVPIFDMIFTTVMRIREEKIKTLLEWLRYGGKDHFHHYLVDLGFQPLGAVIFIYFVTLSLGISAIMVSNDVAIEGFLTLSQASIIFGIIATLIVMGKRRHRRES
jgi:UDP-GlcNAc:undecaprenyl-phosphate GlcNAc-1-phosphate transferase